MSYPEFWFGGRFLVSPDETEKLYHVLLRGISTFEMKIKFHVLSFVRNIASLNIDILDCYLLLDHVDHLGLEMAATILNS